MITKRNSIPDRLLYSRREAAELLGVSLWMIDRLIQEEKLNTLRVGDRPMVPKTELERFAGVAQ